MYCAADHANLFWQQSSNLFGQYVCSSPSCIIAISLHIASERCGLRIQVDVEASGVAVGVTGVVVEVDVVVVTSSLK